MRVAPRFGTALHNAGPAEFAWCTNRDMKARVDQGKWQVAPAHPRSGPPTTPPPPSLLPPLWIRSRLATFCSTAVVTSVDLQRDALLCRRAVRDDPRNHEAAHDCPAHRDERGGAAVGEAGEHEDPRSGGGDHDERRARGGLYVYT